MNEKAKAFFSRVVKRAPVPVTIPELGTVFVRELTLRERVEVEQAAAKKWAPSHLALLVAAATVDEAGNQLFSPDDAAEIDEMAPSVIAPLSRAAAAINLLAPAEAAKETPAAVG